jgi:predicted nucleic acid-binding protein
VSRERVYWDSDCFLGWLQAEPDKVDACREVLEEADAGRVIIVTSALTIAEVLAMRRREPIDRSRRENVEGFFRRSYIAVQNVTRTIAEHARSVVWDNGVLPKDAIHVATALATKVARLNTFDQGLLSKSGLIGSPALAICRPFVVSPKLDLRPPVQDVVDRPEA